MQLRSNTSSEVLEATPIAPMWRQELVLTFGPTWLLRFIFTLNGEAGSCGCEGICDAPALEGETPTEKLGFHFLNNYFY